MSSSNSSNSNHPRSLSRKLSASLLSLLSSSRSSTPTPNATLKIEPSPTRPRTESRASQLSNLSTLTTLSTSTLRSLAKVAKHFRKVRDYRRRETIRPGFHPFNLPSSNNSSVIALDSLGSPHDLSLRIATPVPHRISTTPSDYPVRFPSSEWSAWSDLGDEEDWFARPPAPRMRSYSDASTVSETSSGKEGYEEDDEPCTGHVYEPEEYASFESLIDPSFSSSPPSSSFSPSSSHTSRTSSRDISTSSIITFPSSASSHQTPPDLRKSGPPPKSEPRGPRPRSPIFSRAQSRMTPGHVETEDVFAGRNGVRWRRNSVEW